MKIHTLDYVKSFIENEGYVFLDDRYINSVAKLKLQCPKGHVFPMSFKVFRNGHRCSYCAGKRQYNLEEVAEIFKQQGYTLISNNYESNRDKLRVLGPDGKEYETTLFSFKVQKIIPHLKGLNRFIGEQECRDFFEKITEKKFPKCRPSWLINPFTGRGLELDGFNEELNIAFEYDGIHHFENIYEDSDVRINHNRDFTKNEICKKRGVRLIRVPYYIDNKYAFIENEIKRPNTYMYLGDPHAKLNNLDELNKLIDFSKTELLKNGCNNLIILGDLFHSHAVVRLEVLTFWLNSLNELMKQFKIYIVAGNHDMILGDSEYSGISAIKFLEQKYHYDLKIIDEPNIHGNIGMIPYMENHNDFVKEANKLKDLGAKVLVCHQTYSGSQFENGFFAPNGINPDLLNYDLIISGHIHSRQRFGKVVYPGTARWDSISDANQSKGLWLVHHDGDTGAIAKEEFIDTSSVCRPFHEFIWEEGKDIPIIPSGCRVVLELVGSSSWINKQKKALKGTVEIRTKITDKANKANKAARQPGKDFSDFVKNLYVTSIDRKALLDFMTELKVV